MVITFSRFFQSNHPRAGEPTHFVERIIGNLILLQKHEYGSELWHQEIVTNEGIRQVAGDIMWKGHTIRAGKRFKAGQWFDPRVWSGAPYRSKQIQFAPKIQIVKTWDIDIDEFGVISINGKYSLEYVENMDKLFEFEKKLARNDGLYYDDFNAWLVHPVTAKRGGRFHGQIVSWDPKIEY